MGYRIVYGTEYSKKSKKSGGSVRLRTMIAAAFLFFALTVRLTWQEGSEIMRRFLLPGDLTVTELAFAEMVSDLREGEKLADALTVFCAEILHEAS